MADLPWRAIHVIFTIVTALFAAWTSFHRARKEEIDSLKRRVDDEVATLRREAKACDEVHRTHHEAALQRVHILERGYSKMNERLQHLPTTREVGDNNAILREVAAKLTSIDKRLDRVEDYMHTARVPS